jgi:serine/threonine-protein kinase
MAEQVAAGLDVAHEAGVVHRDLKPQNLFFAEGDRPCWKILDFGVATTEASHGTLTATDNVIGTPAYMSPEQAVGDAVTRRSDLFSFGSVLYRAVTGAPPFAGGGAAQVLYSVAHEMPIRPGDLAPDLPPDVEAVLAIALAKDASDRFDAASAAARALRAAVSNVLPPRLRQHAQRILARHPWQHLKSAS